MPLLCHLLHSRQLITIEQTNMTQPSTHTSHQCCTQTMCRMLERRGVPASPCSQYQLLRFRLASCHGPPDDKSYYSSQAMTDSLTIHAASLVPPAIWDLLLLHPCLDNDTTILFFSLPLGTWQALSPSASCDRRLSRLQRQDSEHICVKAKLHWVSTAAPSNSYHSGWEQSAW